MPLDKKKNYNFIIKDGSSNAFTSLPPINYSVLPYSSIITNPLPNSASISIECYKEANTKETYKLNNKTYYVRRHLYALKNVLNGYISSSPHYAYSSSLGNKESQRVTLINIPSIFYGSSIDKGSVELEFEISGTVIAKLNDINKNGELIQVLGNNGSGNVAGVVLYNEGFILLTGSWTLDNYHQEIYDSGSSNDYPRWIYWGSGNSSCSVDAPSSSYDLNFQGINYINTVTMFAHADKNDLNHSNNPTFIDFSSSNNLSPTVTTTNYSENEFLTIKNTTKYPYENYTGSLEKQVFITKIGIYDENKNLIAIAKVSKPIRKTEERDFTFKLKLDI